MHIGHFESCASLCPNKNLMFFQFQFHSTLLKITFWINLFLSLYNIQKLYCLCSHLNPQMSLLENPTWLCREDLVRAWSVAAAWSVLCMLFVFTNYKQVRGPFTCTQIQEIQVVSSLKNVCFHLFVHPCFK